MYFICWSRIWVDITAVYDFNINFNFIWVGLYNRLTLTHHAIFLPYNFNIMDFDYIDWVVRNGVEDGAAWDKRLDFSVEQTLASS